MSLETLQIYWWVITSLLLGILAFMFFVQGGQTLLNTLAKNAEEKSLIINSLGRKWELTFTTLVMFGGAMFAAFPLFYSVSFGGAYWVWLLILFCFIIQAVSYEYRKKPDNVFGAKTYETFLYINGLFGVFLLGVALSTFFSGAHFTLSALHFVQWQHPLRGLEALFNPFNLLLGFALVFLSRMLGAGYLLNNIHSESIAKRVKRQIWLNGLLFLVFLFAFLAWIFTKEGFGLVDSQVQLLPNYYFWILIENPLFLILFCIGAILLLLGIYLGGLKGKTSSIFYLGLGTTLAVFALFANLGINGGVFYPSLNKLSDSLSIFNASSSLYTLQTMAYVSLLIPFVLSYIIYVWRAMDAKKLTTEELNQQDETY